MIWLSPLAFIFFLGAAAVFQIIRSAAFPHKLWMTAALALPVGFSLASIALFISYLIRPSQGFLIALMTLLVLACFLTLRILTKPTPLQTSTGGLASLKTKVKQTGDLWHRLSPIEKTATVIAGLLFLVSLQKLLAVYTSVSMGNIFGGWDARFFWNVKAKFLFRSPEEWGNMFASDLNWAHPDYPLLIPASVAWGWFWSGKELQIWPPLVAFSFYLSLTFWITWFLTTTTRLMNGLLGGAFFMTIGAIAFWSVSQYADVPLAFFMTAAASLLLIASQTTAPSLFFLSGWLAGCAAWTKNEGVFFLVWFMLIAAALLLIRRTSLSEIKKAGLALAGGMALPLFCVVILKLDLAPHGDYLGSGRSPADYLAAIFGDPQKTQTIMKGFLVYFKSYSSWNGLWYLATAALICAIAVPRLRRDRSVVTLGGFTLCILAGYFVVLHTSPHNIVFQIQTALERLLIHAAGPALLLIFTVLHGLVGKKNSNK